MKKYVLGKIECEIPYKHRLEIQPGVARFANDTDWEELALYDNHDDALKALSEHQSYIRKTSGVVGALWQIVEYFVEDVEFDDEENKITDYYGNIDLSEMRISVVADNKTIATFDNLPDAEQALNDAAGSDKYDAVEIEFN